MGPNDDLDTGCSLPVAGSSRDYFAVRPTPPRSLTLNTSFRPKLSTKYPLKIRSMTAADSLLGGNGRSKQTHASYLGGQQTPRMGRLFGAVLNGSSSNSNESNEIFMIDGSFADDTASQTVPRPPSPAPTADYSMVSPPSPMSFVHVRMPSGTYDVVTSPTSGPEGTPDCTHFVQRSRGFATERWTPRRNPNKLGKAALGRIWGALSSPARKGKYRNLSFRDGLPLDGEEGELIDEACFFEQRKMVGCEDIIGFSPPEVALEIFTYLDLQTTLSCRLVCKYWNALANDSYVWRSLFCREMDSKGWKIDESRAAMDRLSEAGIDIRRKRLLSLSSISSRTTFDSPVRSNSVHIPRLAPLAIDWQQLYKTRVELDKRWRNSEPKTTRLTGHEDSVYCLEFDADKIVTGSRDRTIKIWDIHTGNLRATLRGHAGSVLCLKFDFSKDGSRRSVAANDDILEDIGFMVSGSSDRTVLVWDLRPLIRTSRNAGKSASPINAGPELVARVLKGHSGGVLDLRMNKQWIVSCSKDSLIRVWNRKTFDLASTLRGHDGPVNAVGLFDDKLVSASGDGKMMLWDIKSGERIRTFEGHARGLACIDFQGDAIITGSNDCKIKVWRASTGECLQTLMGHSMLVRALAFDPNTRRLVSASYDRSVKVWDLDTGKVVREFKHGHSSHIFDVKFDVRRIVSTSHDQKIVVLDFGSDLDTSLLA